jgi:hypothetical protein
MKQIMVLFLFLIASAVFAIDESQTLARSQFEDIAIQRGGVNVNNFSIKEDTSWMSRDLQVIRVSFSARNRNDTAKHFSIMLVGFDSTGNILWSIALEPVLGTISENRTEEVSGSFYCSAGTLRQTQKIWYRIIGDF